jgi:GNAT superfamily N-acetyltransferase
MIMSNLRIVNAVESDVPVILDFIKQLAEYEKLSHQVVATVETLEKSLFGQRANAQVILAELDGRKVGFAIFYTNFSTFLGKPGIYLEDLFVVPEARGKGIGKKLLAYLARLTKERDYGRLDWAVLDWNKPSIDFYESIGAKPLSDWIVYRLQGEALQKMAERAP